MWSPTGVVTINGHDYTVNPRIVHALQQKRASYNAGVVGPDGYPDLVMGQSVIHPANTGLWLQHVLNKGWAAQSDPRYTEDEKLEILAFSYGYLTHAAGRHVGAHADQRFRGGRLPLGGRSHRRSRRPRPSR